MIKEIKIENFKSIPSLNLELGRLNVFIGANGSGKYFIEDLKSREIVIKDD